jgi:hypothetical protein
MGSRKHRNLTATTTQTVAAALAAIIATTPYRGGCVVALTAITDREGST